MRILLMAGHHHMGGAETAVMNLTDLLLQNGHEVAHFVSATSPSCQLCEDFFYTPSSTNSTGFRQNMFSPAYYKNILNNYNPLRYAQLKSSFENAIRQFQPDVVHIHHLPELYFNPQLLTIPHHMNIPMVMTFHGPGTVCPNGLLLKGGLQGEANLCDALCVKDHKFGASCIQYKCIGSPYRRNKAIQSLKHRYEILAKSADCITAPSDALLNLVKASNRLPQDILQFLYNPFPKVLYDKAAQLDQNRDDGRYFLFVGRIEQCKGVRVILEAAKALLPLSIPIKIVGEGKDKPRIISEIEANRLSHVECLSWQSGDALWNLYKNARAVLIPSTGFENAPMVTLESFAHRRPVIASRIGGIPDYVHHGENGYLVTPGNTGELASAMKNLWENPGLAHTLGDAGADFFNTRLNADTVLQAYLECYRQAIQRYSKRS